MKGTYVLVASLSEDKEIEVGKLGKIGFSEGAYAYVGSALNGLRVRVERHLRKDKKLYWHIDYLLVEAQVEDIIYAEDEVGIECKIAEILDNSFPWVEGFGSSDCRCKSHLFFSSDIEDFVKDIKASFEEAGLEPEVW